MEYNISDIRRYAAINLYNFELITLRRVMNEISVFYCALQNQVSLQYKFLKMIDKLQVGVKESILSININENMEVLNFKDSSDINLSEVKLLHYSGKSKPWTVKGALHPLSNYYQSVYFDVFSRRYHIQNNWKKLALKHFLIVLLKNKLKYLNNPISFCFNFFRYLFK